MLSSLGSYKLHFGPISHLFGKIQTSVQLGLNQAQRPPPVATEVTTFSSSGRQLDGDNVGEPVTPEALRVQGGALTCSWMGVWMESVTELINLWEEPQLFYITASGLCSHMRQQVLLPTSDDGSGNSSVAARR